MTKRERERERETNRVFREHDAAGGLVGIPFLHRGVDAQKHLEPDFGDQVGGGLEVGAALCLGLGKELVYQSHADVVPGVYVCWTHACMHAWMDGGL